MCMDAIIKPIEKMKPFFDKVARNKYLKAIKDGFISSMPIILFSSIFLLIHRQRLYQRRNEDVQ